MAPGGLWLALAAAYAPHFEAERGLRQADDLDLDSQDEASFLEDWAPGGTGGNGEEGMPRRRRDDIQNKLEMYAKTPPAAVSYPWSDDFGAQDTVKKEQKKTQREMEHAEEVTKDELKEKVTTVEGPVMETVDRLRSVAAMLKKGTADMKREQSKTVDQYDYDIIQLERDLKAIIEKDGFTIQKAEMEAKVEADAMKEEIETCVKEVNRKMVPMEKTFKQDQQVMMEKAMKASTRVEESQVIFERNLERLTNKHKQNVRTIEDLSKEYDSVFAELKQILQQAPTYLELKARDIKGRLADQTMKRDEIAEDFAVENLEADKEFHRAAMKLPDLAKELLQTSLWAAQYIKEGYLHAMDKDQKQYKALADEQTEALQQQAFTAGQLLSREVQSTRNKQALKLEAFHKEMEKELTYPPSLTETFEEMKGDAATKVIDVRNGRQAMLNSARQSYQSDLKQFVDQQRNRIEESLHAMSEKQDKVFEDAETANEDLLFGPQHALSESVNKVALMENEINEASETVNKLWKQIINQKKYVKTVENEIIKHMTSRDAGHLKQSQEQLAEARRQINRYMAQATQARNAAITDIKDTESKLTTQFDEQASDMQADFTERIGRLRSSVAEMKSAALNIQQVLTDKLTDTEAAMIKVVGEDGSSGQLAQMNGIVENLNMKALEAIGHSAPEAVRDTLEKADGMVEHHITGLKAMSQGAVEKIAETTAPLMQKTTDNEIAATEGQANPDDPQASVLSFDDEVQTIKSNLGNSLQLVKDEVGAATRLVDEDLSKSEVAKQEQKVTGALESAHQVLQQQEEKARLADQQTGSNINLQSGNYDDQIADAVRTIAQKADSSAETARQAVVAQTDMARSTVGSDGQMNSATIASVDATISATNRRAAKVESTSSTMSKAVAELEALVGKNKAEVGSQAAGLEQQMRDGQAGAAANKKAVSDMMKGGGNALMTDAQKELAGEASDASEGIADASHKASRTLNEADGPMAHDRDAIDDQFGDLAHKADEKVGQQQSVLQRFTDQVKGEKLTEHQKAQKLKLGFEAVAEDAAKHSRKFDDAMKRTGRILGQLVGADEDQMADLTDRLADLQEHAQETAAQQGQVDHKAIEKILEEAADARTDVEQQVHVTKQKVKAATERLGKFDEQASQAIAASDQTAATFDEKLSGATRTFSKLVSQEQLARGEASRELLATAQKNVDTMAAISDAIRTTEKKTTASVQYRLGLLGLQEDKIKKKLAHTAELEKYQEEDALHKVMDKLKAAKEESSKLNRWMDKTSTAADSFKSLVVNQFEELGHELDLSAMEISEEEAAEAWAVQNQARALKEHLGEELEGLSGVSAARLEDLAKTSGARIAAIMKMEGISELERAKLLAEAKEHAKKMASKIMEEGKAMELDQATAARNLKIATHEIEDSVDRMASIESQGPQQEGLSHIIKSAHTMLDDARSHMAQPDELEDDAKADDAAPSALLQTTTAKVAQQQYQEALLEAAAAESEQALAGDAQMQDRVASLAARVL